MKTENKSMRFERKCHMLYELRIYHMHPGRLPAIHERFSEHTLALFDRHGIKIVDFWEDADGKDTIYYTLEHEDRASRDKNFESFSNDPEWKAVRTASELDGPIVSSIEVYFMNRVPYSPIK
jgi:hypothetical protein